MTVPRVVQPGTEETACLMLHQFSRESNVDLQLFILQNENTITSEEHTFRHGGKLFHHDIQIVHLNILMIIPLVLKLGYRDKIVLRKFVAKLLHLYLL